MENCGDLSPAEFRGDKQMGFLEKIFGTYSEKELKSIRPEVDAVLALE